MAVNKLFCAFRIRNENPDTRPENRFLLSTEKFSFVKLYIYTLTITIKILDTVNRLVSYLKHDVSDTGFCLRP
jgi:hypothetical protein